MIERDPAEEADHEETAPARPERTPRKSAPIVPPQNVAGSALILVIAIMTFLSCLTFGAVTRVRDTAATWQSLTTSGTKRETAFALEQLPQLTARPQQIAALRQTILDLAVRGKLVRAGWEGAARPDRPRR